MGSRIGAWFDGFVARRDVAVVLTHFLGILLRRRHGAHHVLGARNFLVVPHGRAEPGVGGRVYEDHAESGHVCA